MVTANATDATNATVAAIVGTDKELSYGEKIGIVSTLEDDILIIDNEIAKCQKAKKGWIAATVVGGAGVVATGIAAAVQGAKIADKKKELEQHNADIKTKQEQLTNLQGKQ
jgi:hypothetical protein